MFLSKPMLPNLCSGLLSSCIPLQRACKPWVSRSECLLNCHCSLFGTWCSATVPDRTDQVTFLMYPSHGNLFPDYFFFNSILFPLSYKSLICTTRVPTCNSLCWWGITTSLWTKKKKRSGERILLLSSKCNQRGYKHLIRLITGDFCYPFVACTNVQCLWKLFLDTLSGCFLKWMIAESGSRGYPCLVWSDSPESSFNSQL